MNIATAITEELKGLDNSQLESIYRIIKSLKSKSKKKQRDISLEEIWKITSRSKGNWSQTLEELREERGC